MRNDAVSKYGLYFLVPFLCVNGSDYIVDTLSQNSFHSEGGNNR